MKLLKYEAPYIEISSYESESIICASVEAVDHFIKGNDAFDAGKKLNIDFDALYTGSGI